MSVRGALCLALAASCACQPQPVHGTHRGILQVSVDGDIQAPAVDLSDDVGALAPGASVTATVTFAPAGVGAQTTRVTFSPEADAALPSLELSGTGS